MICCVLAAGSAERFEGNKLLALLDGKEVIKHIVDNLPSEFVTIFLITGKYHQSLENLEFSKDVRFLFNENSFEGKWTSVKLAIEYAKSLSEDLFLTLGDIPYVTEDENRKLINAFNENSNSVFAINKEVVSPPAIIAVTDLKNLNPKPGFKLKNEVMNFKTVNLENNLRDIDYKTDLG